MKSYVHMKMMQFGHIRTTIDKNIGPETKKYKKTLNHGLTPLTSTISPLCPLNQCCDLAVMFLHERPIQGNSSEMRTGTLQH